MALASSPDTEALADVVRAFSASQHLRAGTREVLENPVEEHVPGWKQMAELGWLGLHVPEEYGGSGFGLQELAVVVEALGAVPAHGPFLSTVVASAIVVAVGSPAQRAALLPGLVDGSTTASIPVAETDGAGTGTVMLGGRWAAVHLVPVGSGDLAVIPADADGLIVEPLTGLDPSLGLARLGTEQVAAPAHILRGGREMALHALRVLAAAEASGGARTCLELTLSYAKVREQFGRAIGSFQAVKHHLADMFSRAELATAVAWGAARSGIIGPEAALMAAVATTIAGEAYDRNARMQIQLHGGIGFTWEHDAHLFLRRAAALRAVTGPAVDAEDQVYALTRGGVRPRSTVDLPPEAERHRRNAVAFLQRWNATPEDGRRELLVESGYLVPHWPRPWGRGADAVEQLVIEEELARIDIPDLRIGGWVMLTLLQTATAEQIERWVDPGLRGEHRWCQLFSEPGAGSDAAAVQTRGARVDGGWRITGQKVWTSDAHNCDRGLATVRTNPSAPKHGGITAVVVDLTAVGVTVRPLREISGDALFNEVFFDDVFVPDADVVGEVDGGWAVARATLGNERVTIGRGTATGKSALELIELRERRAPADSGLAREIGRTVADEHAIRLVNLRQVERAVIGVEPSATGSLTKLLVAEHSQAVSDLGLRIAGIAGVDGSEPDFAYGYLFDRCTTIAGGTSEVSRNVIAERILGLPREAHR